MSRTSRSSFHEPALQRFMKRTSTSRPFAIALWTELEFFLQAATESAEGLTPSCALDELWHDFVLDTPAYEQYCTHTLGTFVHHVPTDTPDRDSYRRTRALLESLRSTPLDPQIWPISDLAAGHCSGKCGSSCRRQHARTLDSR